ncbi:MAG: penicillin-binding protein 2 [Verrucomicrobia bacterium]|nr:penicillin-binding protein 2 [Verrucomicrobiota bacterium]
MTLADTARRAWLPAAVLVLGFVGLGLRLHVLQVVQHDHWLAESERNTQRLFLMEPRRGEILDANGNPLTASLPIKRVFANPRLLGPRYAEVAHRLAPLLAWDEAALAQRLRPFVCATNRFGEPVTNAYVNLHRKVSAETWQQVTQTMAGIVQHAVQSAGSRKLTPGEAVYYRGLRSAALYAMDDYDRLYTCNRLASHVIGFAQDRELTFNRKTVFPWSGRDGVEFWFDGKLAGIRGWNQTETDHARRELLPFREAYVEPKPGLSVVLTIDMVIQGCVEAALADLVARHTPESVSVIVIRPRTGEILAMATLPNYDPNRPGEVPVDHLRNRAVADLYEPGSTFKIVTIAAALSEGVVRMDDVIDCETAPWYYLGHRLRDHGRFGPLTVRQILVKSSNIGVAKIALMLGEERFQNYVKRFGFGQRTGITLGGERAGIVDPPARRDKLRLTRAAIGQAIAVTPLQMAAAVSAIANGGVLMRPFVVKGLRDQHGRLVARYEPQPVRQVIRDDVNRQMVEALKLAVSEGTGIHARLDLFSAAGKTGTAQIARNGQYVDGEYVSSFIGFLPADRAELCVAITVVKPSGGYYGGTVAAPCFKEIAEQIALYLKLRPDRQPVAGAPGRPGLVRAGGD